MNHIKDYDTYFEKYMGRIFFRIIRKNKFKEINTAVEFAPGFKYKIAYSLKRIGFKGTLYVIDINENVLKFVYKRYKRILPDANIVLINSDLIGSLKYLPKKIDVFLANHPIDDVIISKYLESDSVKKAFDNTIESKEFLIECWNSLKQEQATLLNIENVVYDEFKNFFQSIEFKLIVISQYKSGYYKDNENYVEVLSRVIFDRLDSVIATDKKALEKAMDFDFPDFDVALLPGFSLKENIQNPKNWIAGVYKNTI